MSDVFDEELRAQLAEARVLRARAREAGDEDGVQAYGGRITQLLRIAAHHGIVLDRAADEEEED
ncbi:hypothetical protein [Streptomyces sp. CB01881]|uniref:hypothetical protein n=1 Tax=Streptomyces sp. CB01881 TaxID=2078691 RepID=UPI000CDBFD23|nr:hypothetical protein [Streptomyces sp. CB01881]AUY47756.1 hypothetical protein C2142_00855 [Streptomyces sp. CB01881]TYC76233.1 hypothetical protein EH183_00860 [Streptomyces sp. CB01881]